MALLRGADELLAATTGYYLTAFQAEIPSLTFHTLSTSDWVQLTTEAMKLETRSLRLPVLIRRRD
ncbi:MAG: hypothetical protein ACR2HX_24185 [Pyrinomonadaceae bacterium]